VATHTQRLGLEQVHERSDEAASHERDDHAEAIEWEAFIDGDLVHVLAEERHRDKRENRSRRRVLGNSRVTTLTTRDTKIDDINTGKQSVASPPLAGKA
jgi:hypothetical protein